MCEIHSLTMSALLEGLRLPGAPLRLAGYSVWAALFNLRTELSYSLATWFFILLMF